MERKDYQKYRWFYTSANKLVIGGKSADQNEQLLKNLKKQKKNYTVMHTASPGSPFSVILSDKSPTPADLKQVAIFTASFSRAWKLRKKKVEVHIFKLSQLYKEKSMKLGTWGVETPIKKVPASLELALTKQKGKLRAVPKEAVKLKKQIFFKVLPGKIDKQIMIPKLQVCLPASFNQEELLSALPPGGVKIQNDRS
jgi:hypothetical protein